ARVVGLSWEGVEIHGRSSGSGGEGMVNRGRVVMGLVGNLVSEQEQCDNLLDIGCMVREHMYYPWLHYRDYDCYYFSTCDDARCSFHDIYVEVVVTSRHLSYPRNILTPSVENVS
nr:hypothetical protein [Tanacetum cinerariifolium]